MARNIKPKQKQLRRFGLVTSERKKSTVKRKSLHGERLEEKQKIKFLYGLLERQFKIYIQRAQSTPGNAIENLVKELETRLDNVVYRAGFAKTRPHARQLVNHDHVFVDGRKVDIPSFQIKAGQTVSIEPEMFNKKNYQDLINSRENVDIPAWILIENNSAKITRLPSQDDPHEQANMRMIFEIYR